MNGNGAAKANTSNDETEKKRTHTKNCIRTEYQLFMFCLRVNCVLFVCVCKYDDKQINKKNHIEYEFLFKNALHRFMVQDHFNIYIICRVFFLSPQPLFTFSFGEQISCWRLANVRIDTNKTIYLSYQFEFALKIFMIGKNWNHSQ